DQSGNGDALLFSRGFPTALVHRLQIAGFALVGLASCAALTGDSLLDQRYGAPDVARYDVPIAPAAGAPLYAEVRPILERRCVVCHGCYDAPCQLKLGAWEGIARGASTTGVYEQSRLLQARPSRLFMDAQRAS